MAHIGVLRALRRAGVRIDYLAGTSAGAIVAGLYAAGADWAQVEADVKRLKWYHVFEPGMLMGRQVSGRKLMRLLSAVVGKETNIESLPTPLVITAVELLRGETYVFDRGPLLTAIRASIALPGVFRAVEHAEGVFVDGSVLGSVPTRCLRDRGCDVVIAVDVRGLPPHEEVARAACRRRYGVLERSGDVMSRYLTDLQLAEADLVIRPAVGEIPTLQVESISTCIDAGERAVEAVGDAIERLVALSATQGEAHPPANAAPSYNGASVAHSSGGPL